MKKQIYKMLKDKQGGEKYLSIWWFFCLAMIAGAIVISVSMFLTADVETKVLESEILTMRVVDCVIDNGYLKKDLLTEDYNLFEDCFLDRKMFSSQGEYYLSYEIYKYEDCKINSEDFDCNKDGALLGSKTFGQRGFKEQCEIIDKGVIAGHYARCDEKWVYTLDEEGEKLLLYVNTGSNQIIRGIQIRR